MIAPILSAIVVVLGFAIIARTLLEGVGGGLGLLIGALFVIAGVGRLYLQFRHG